MYNKYDCLFNIGGPFFTPHKEKTSFLSPPPPERNQMKLKLSIIPLARTPALISLTKLLKAAHIGPSGAPSLMSSHRRGGDRPITSPAKHAMIGGLKILRAVGPPAMLSVVVLRREREEIAPWYIAGGSEQKG